MTTHQHLVSKSLSERFALAVKESLRAVRPPPPIPVAILGISFDPVTLAEALAKIEAMIASQEPHYVVTANVDFLVQATRDVELHRILTEAHLVLCDGMPLVWVSRLLGNPLPERVAGADLVPQLLRRAAEKHYRLFLLGGAPDVTKQAVANLRARFPDLAVVGQYSPPFLPFVEMDHDEMARRIRAARPDVLLVSFGCPKAEKWMAMHYRSLGVPVMLGVGATVDFLAGRMKRAPRWMQQGGVEWIYRLCQEPRRLLSRYAADVWQFGWRLLRQCACASWDPLPVKDAGHAAIVLAEPAWQRVRAPRQLNLESVRREHAFWERIAADPRHCLLEADEVRRIDNSGVALLIWLQRELHRQERQLILLDPSCPVRRALAEACLLECMDSVPDVFAAWEVIKIRTGIKSPVLANGAAMPVSWQGEITAANTKEVWRLTRRMLQPHLGHQAEVGIDLAEVRYIDSAGMRMMVQMRQHFRPLGANVVFHSPSQSVRHALRRSGLEDLLASEVP